LNDLVSRLLKISNKSNIKKLSDSLGEDAQLYLVGGVVRDAARCKEALDIDIASILPPEEICKRLSKANIDWVPTGVEHGTVLAVVDAQHIEITTFRMPGPRVSNCPNKWSSSIEQDLEGRDFTINAIAFDFKNNKIIDPFSGLSDIQSGVVRSVKNPKLRFEEDPLRILRMIRFGPAQGFKIEEATFNAAKDLIKNLSSISVERIRDEFLKILLSDKASDGLRNLRSLGLLDSILPEIVPSYNFEQNDYHWLDVFEHTLAVIDHTPKNELLRLTALFHDLGKPHTLSVGDDGKRHFYKHEIKSTDLTKDALLRLKLPKQTIKHVSHLVRLHMRPLNCGPVGMRRLMRDLGDLLNDWLLFKEADSLGAKVVKSDFDEAKIKFLEVYNKEKNRASSFLKLSISGDDLKEIGIKEGPELGKILSQLRNKVLRDPSINNREMLLNLVKSEIT